MNIIYCPLCKSDDVFEEDVTIYDMEPRNHPPDQNKPSPRLTINYCRACGFAGEFDEIEMLLAKKKDENETIPRH